MNETRTPTVIVIGAGIAGLTAAWHLTQAGVRVKVLEKNVTVGGRIYTDICNDFEIDVGAQFIADYYTHTLDLIHKLGLQSELVSIPGKAAISRDGQLHKVWPDLHLLFTSLVSWRSKVMLLKVFLQMLYHQRELDFHAFHKAHTLDICSTAEYAQSELNEDLLEYCLQPPLTGVFYWTPEHTSQAMLFISLKMGLSLTDMKIYTFRQGMRQLPEAMAAQLPVHLNVTVSSVATESSSYTIQAQVEGQEHQFIADGVVCTTPATIVPTLFPNLDARQREFFQSVHYSANTAIAIGVGRRLPSDFYGLLFPRCEVNYLAAATVQSARNPAQVPPGRDLIFLGSASQELLAQDDTTIRNRLLADLRKSAPIYDPGSDEQFCCVYRWHQALPEFNVGHFKRLKAFADGEIESGRIVFAGDYLNSPFIEGAVTSGMEAAQRLLKRLEGL